MNANHDLPKLDSATQLVTQIWPLADAITTLPNKLISLRYYIRETLRRSRTSYSTLQVTLWYLTLIRPFVVSAHRSEAQRPDKVLDEATNKPCSEGPSCPLLCGRRMFLAALILASKYLQDRNFTARAWSKITGLPARDIAFNESIFLDKIEWRLHMTEANFKHWNSIILSCANSTRLGRSLVDIWAHVLNGLSAGNSVETISLGLSEQNQDLCNKFKPSITPSMAFTPNSSFGAPSDGISLGDAVSSLPSTEPKDSPASSIGSESTTSGLSFTEAEAPPVCPTHLTTESKRAHYGERRVSARPTLRRQASSQSSLSEMLTRPNLPTPPSSTRCNRLDEDGSSYNPSQAFMETPSCAARPQIPVSTLDLGDLDRLLANCPLVSTTSNPVDSQPALRASSALQPCVNLPHQATQFGAKLRQSPCGLPQHSIVHRRLNCPLPISGTKRGCSEITDALSAASNDNMSKMRCSQSLQGTNPRFASCA